MRGRGDVGMFGAGHFRTPRPRLAATSSLGSAAISRGQRPAALAPDVAGLMLVAHSCLASMFFTGFTMRAKITAAIMGGRLMTMKSLVRPNDAVMPTATPER